MLRLIFLISLLVNIVCTACHEHGSRVLFHQIIRDEAIHLSSSCRGSLQNVLSSSNPAHEDWAITMLSSLAHGAPDLKSGKFANFGDLDNCIQIQRSDFHGKYCLYREHFNLSDPSSIPHVPFEQQKFFKLETIAGSLCLPSVCTDQEVSVIVQKHVALAGTRIEMRGGCQTMESNHEPRLWQEESVFRGILVAWIVVLLSATLVSNCIDSDFLKCFSILENARNVFKKEPDAAYDFLYGFRYYFLIIACWLHIFNMFIFFSPLALVNYLAYRTSLSPGFKILYCNFSHAMSANILWSGEPKERTIPRHP